MKRLMMALLLFAVAAQSIEFRESFPAGRYLGQGYWGNNQGVNGSYISYAEIQGDDIHTDYVWQDGHATIQVSFKFAQDGWFSVVYQGNVVGDGFCMFDQCQYDMQIGDASYTETFTFDEEFFHKIGHRRAGSLVSRWEDVLYKLDISNTTSATSLAPMDGECGPIQ